MIAKAFLVFLYVEFYSCVFTEKEKIRYASFPMDQ